MKKKIAIIATGGTIAGTAVSSTQIGYYQPAVLPISDLIGEIPALAALADVSGEQLTQIDSADMTHAIWLALARRINALLDTDETDGIVVTHGTDTMEETAYFLNLVVKSDKPVVMVGALRPANAMSTDGPMNLYNAVALAAHPAAVGKGVLVSLNDTINASRDVTKTNTSLQDAFKAPELGYLGYIQGATPYFYRIPARKHTAGTEFDLAGLTDLPHVDIIYAHVNSSPLLAQAAVATGAKGLVYAGVGNGGMSETMREALTQIAGQNVIIVRSTRVSSGIVTRNAAVNDDRCNFIVADTLNPQKARVLLMLALTKTTAPAEIQRMFWEY
jgi:L-asparaginase